MAGLRKLTKQTKEPAPPIQLIDCLSEPSDIAWALLVAEAARQFEDELEAVRRLLDQPGDHRHSRQSVKSEVQLDQRKVPAIVCEELSRPCSRRVKTSHPIRVGIA